MEGNLSFYCRKCKRKQLFNKIIDKKGKFRILSKGYPVVACNVCGWSWFINEKKFLEDKKDG